MFTTPLFSELRLDGLGFALRIQENHYVALADGAFDVPADDAALVAPFEDFHHRLVNFAENPCFAENFDDFGLKAHHRHRRLLFPFFRRSRLGLFLAYDFLFPGHSSNTIFSQAVAATAATSYFFLRGARLGFSAFSSLAFSFALPAGFASLASAFASRSAER